MDICEGSHQWPKTPAVRGTSIQYSTCTDLMAALVQNDETILISVR